MSRGADAGLPGVRNLKHPKRFTSLGLVKRCCLDSSTILSPTIEPHPSHRTMKNSFTTIVCSLTLLALAACSSLQKRSQKLQLGMTKAAAIEILGSDYTVVAARAEADGSPVSVLKFSEGKKDNLFLYFRNDKLAQWGDADALKAMPPASSNPGR